MLTARCCGLQFIFQPHKQLMFLISRARLEKIWGFVVQHCSSVVGLRDENDWDCIGTPHT